MNSEIYSTNENWWKNLAILLKMHVALNKAPQFENIVFLNKNKIVVQFQAQAKLKLIAHQ